MIYQEERNQPQEFGVESQIGPTNFFDQSHHGNFIMYGDFSFTNSQESCSMTIRLPSKHPKNKLQKTKDIPKKKELKHTHEFSGEVLRKKPRQPQEKNTPRFLFGMVVRHISQFKDQYPLCIYQKVEAYCIKELQRTKENKKHVYLMKHLKQFLGNEEYFGVEGCQINRKVFNVILQLYGRSDMFLPKSQVKKNKKKYLQTSKVFRLRCRCKGLIGRVQSQ